MDFGAFYKDSIRFDTARKSAKKCARQLISDHFFTLAAGAFLGLSFAFGMYYAFRFFAFLLSATGRDFNFPLMFAAYFLAFPGILGTIRFFTLFHQTGKADFYAIFHSFFTPKEFGRSLSRSLFCLVSLAFALSPFALCAAAPYAFAAGEKVILVFEILSFFLLTAGILAWLSFITERRLKREIADFYLSFLLHLAVAFLTKGVYLIFLVPYICLSFIFLKEKPP